MAPRFEAEIQQLEEFTYVRLVGVIDEDNELAPLVNRIRGQTAIIDLAGIEDINNCGVRDWVNCLELLQGREIKVVLVECSPSIVAKLNTVSNFIEQGFVKSFYVPYFCQACDQEKALLVDMDEFRGDAAVKTPTCRCDSCDGIMAFDDLEQSYFAFVRDARKAVPPESVQALLAQISPTASGDRKIISKTGVGHSSFAGIPSTSSTSQVSSQFSTGVSSVAPPSAATLRQLRDKTGLRMMRRVAGEGGSTTRSRSRRLAITLAVVAAALGLVVGLVLLVGLS